MKLWLLDNDTEMYSTYDEGKSIVSERLIKTFKIKFYKHMTSVSKTVYIDKLDHIVNKYNNTCHGTIKVKPVDVKSSTSIYHSVPSNDNDSKFKVGYPVRLSKYKNVFCERPHSKSVRRSFWY